MPHPSFGWPTKMKKHFISIVWILFWTLLFSCSVKFSYSVDIGNVGCYSTNSETNQHWKLIWEDEFTSGNLSNWIANNETTICSTNGNLIQSCATPENVQLHNGQLVLIAKHGNHYVHHFTGATLTHQGHFQYGRYEIRAAFPLGEHIESGIYLNNQMRDVDGRPTHVGLAEIAANGQQKKVLRSLTGFVPDATLQLNIELPDQFPLNHYHLYGIEWHQTIARFFFDGQYSDPIHGYFHDMWHHRMFFSIAVKDFGGIVTEEEAQKLEWICPAMIVDYVHVYEAVEETKEHLMCNFPQPASNDVLDPICSIALNQSRPNSPSPPKAGRYISEWMDLLRCVIGFLSIALFFYLMYLLVFKFNFGSFKTADSLVSYSKGVDSERIL